MITMDVAAITSLPEAERRARLQALRGAPGPGGQHEQAPAPESAPAAPAAP